MDAGSATPASWSITCSRPSTPRSEPPDVLPRRKEPSERGLLDRFDLGAQRRERASPQPAQHLHGAPLGSGGARAELPVHDAAVGGQTAECVGDDGDAEAEAARDILRRERPVGAGVAAHEIAEGIIDGFDERRGDADREADAEGVAQARGILDHGPAGLAGDRHPQHPVRPREVSSGR